MSNVKLWLYLALPALVALAGCSTSIKDRYLDGAKRGIPEFQAGAGAMFLNGGPAEINYDEALVWLKAAAAENNAVAIAYLAEFYENGYGSAAPDRQKAARFYDKAFEPLQKAAGEGQIGAAYALGKMYRHGSNVPVNYTIAMQLFRPGVSAGYAPAVNQLGEMFASGQGVTANREKARELFFTAAEKNLPAAQYNLAEYYFSADNPTAGMKWLSRAADNKYPPAIYKMAELLEAGVNAAQDKERAAAMLRTAAAAGYAPAQFKLSLLTVTPETKMGLMTQAVERNYAPAMLALAEYYLKNSAYSQTKAMTLYELARKAGSTNAEQKIAELDAQTGLYLFIKFIWYDYNGGDCFILANSPIERIIAGYRAGITSGSRAAFEQDLQKSSEQFYLNNDWYEIYRTGIPFAWAGDIFRTVLDKEKDKPGYWFCYGSCIAMAGQGEGVMFAMHRLNQLMDKITDSEDKLLMNELAVLLKAQGLLLLHRESEAYSYLFAYGKFKLNRNASIINYINFHAQVLLKDKNKFSVATGIEPGALKEYKQPEKQLFFDAQLERDTDGETPVAEPVVTERKP
jgi:TPR repeat protein